MYNLTKCKSCLNKGRQHCECLNDTNIPSLQPHISLRDMKRVNKLERVYIKLLSYKENLNLHLVQIDAIRLDVIQQVESVFRSESDKYFRALEEVDRKILEVNQHKEQISDKANQVLEAFKAKKLEGLLDSYVKLESFDFTNVINQIKQALFLDNSSLLKDRAREAKTEAPDAFNELKALNVSLQQEIQDLNTELQNLKFHNRIKPQGISLHQGLSKELDLIKGKLNKKTSQKQYLLSTLSLISDKLKAHLLLSQFDISPYNSIIEAFCIYLNKTHFSSSEFIFKEEDLDYIAEGNECDICKYSVEGSLSQHYNGRKLCWHCLKDQTTAVLEVNYELVCKNSHVMMRYENREELAMRILRTEEVVIVCDRCGNELNGKVKAWHCSICEYDLCLDCQREHIGTSKI